MAVINPTPIQKKKTHYFRGFHTYLVDAEKKKTWNEYLKEI